MRFWAQKWKKSEELNSGTRKTFTNPFVLLASRASGTENGIFAPMAPTLINVMVSLVFWDRFSSFSDSGREFHYFYVKITFRTQKPQSRPKLLESCSRNFHFWTRKKLEGFFLSNQAKSFLIVSQCTQSETLNVVFKCFT